jgi:hypothetical protein
LIALARAPDGAVATDAQILDARRGLRLSIDLPKRLTSGDRSLLSALVENGRAEAATVRLDWKLGDGLHVESVRIQDAPQKPPRSASGPITLTLPPGAEVRLFLDVEAAQAGSGQALIEATVGENRQQMDAPYEVLIPDAPPADGGRLQLKRSLYTWTEVEPSPPADGGTVRPEPVWTRTPVSPADRLVSGQLLEVREEFTLIAPLGPTRWTQPVPATCAPLPQEPAELPAIGVPQPNEPTGLTFRVPELPAGRHVHAYFLAVGRPGACVLRAPQVRATDGPLPVTIEPPNLRLIVAD